MHELNEFFSFVAGKQPFSVPMILLPIGISFHTFQAISYTTDVYLGIERAERGFIKFALFIAWFPQMVAGPIERAQTLLHQLARIRRPERFEIREALLTIAWGLFKKLAIADNLITLVDQAFGLPQEKSPLFVALGVYAFALQIYCDFSGYTDIAKGSSLLFGVRLTENFNLPYLARTFAEFWKRWHISLSTWFFEYIYFPWIRKFGEGRGPAIGIMIVFTLSGIWHGANWTFLVWGLLNGAIYLGQVHLIRRWPKLSSPDFDFILLIINFHLICLCWIFFRAESLSTAVDIVEKVANLLIQPFHGLSGPVEGKVLWRALGASIALAILLANAQSGFFLQRQMRHGARWAGALTLIVLLILVLGNLNSQSFIYFQF